MGGEFKGDVLGGGWVRFGEMGHSLCGKWDFNIKRFPKERVGCRVISRAMKEFSELLITVIILIYL